MLRILTKASLILSLNTWITYKYYMNKEQLKLYKTSLQIYNKILRSQENAATSLFVLFDSVQRSREKESQNYWRKNTELNIKATSDHGTENFPKIYM